MHKLVILVEPLDDEQAFDDIWPHFLHLSERMPGLQREATCRVEDVLYGRYQLAFIHELYFESAAAIQAAMISPDGQAAGELLQKMTAGRMTLLIADHKEDELENIRKYHQPANSDDRTRRA
ncbi:MAG: hypothetical protein A2Z45_10190 [Chloroflexi bacterium RBG_19FT_COMBO_55_16]|nr:MAG: hypothetical protein A2Z45_10190 [Chloroflexi bacterium RBG_19FT_COMBO_55_16]